MDQKQQIIIDHFRSGKSQRKIAKDVGVSRNTVKKYILAYLEETGQSPGGDLQPGGIVHAPCYDSSNRQKRKLTSEVTGLIEGFLASNQEKISQGKSKQQMKGVDIHEALVDMGHQIGYTTVCEYIRLHKQSAREVYIRQQYAPGEAVEFDWGEVKIKIGGIKKKMMLAVFTSSFSNHRWAMLFYRQDMSSFLQSHASYFAAVGAVTGEMVYDNMRVAVRRFTLKNKDKEATEDLLKLSAYYQFGIRFCNRGKGNEKGHVERSVEYVRRKAFARIDEFASLDQANAHLWEVCDRLNERTAKGQSIGIAEAFSQEIPCMRPVPASYEACNLIEAKVSKYSCIKLDNNFYSVSEGHVGSWVHVKVYPHRIEAFDHQNKLIAQHERRHSQFQWYIKLDHYLKTLAKKPGALPRSVAWHQADPKLHTLFENHFSHQPKMFIELLLWARKEDMSIEKVIQATQNAATASLNSPTSLEKIQLLATQKMATQLHQPDPAVQNKDPISIHAHQQLAQIQSFFSQSQNH